MGLDVVPINIFELSFMSPDRNLNELPERPCRRRNLSSLFGLSVAQFKTVHNAQSNARAAGNSNIHIRPTIFVPSFSFSYLGFCFEEG